MSSLADDVHVPDGGPRPAAPFTLSDLEQMLRAVDPAALFVPPRILKRVIKEDGPLRGLELEPPHDHSYVIRREPLLRIADHADLGVAADAVLPDRLILLARPDPDEFAARSSSEALVECWRRLFHARIHLTLMTRIEQGLLTASDVRRRVQQIGPTEVEEIRSVLQQEDLLLPPADDQTVYVEFAAVYLELRYFDRQLLPHYFPGLARAEHVEDLLREDLDANSLFHATRPHGAPDPATVSRALTPRDLEVWSEDAEADDEAAPAPTKAPSESAYRRQMRRADRAAGRGNLVRALICRARAEAYAPPELVETVRAARRRELEQFVGRLQTALGGAVGERSRWLVILQALLRGTTLDVLTAEAKLLFDLQKVCVDHEHEVYTVDLVEWALSFGRRPIKRLLPNQRDVMMCKHLRAVARRLFAVRLADTYRRRLSDFIHEASHQAEERVRERLRPVLLDVLDEVGLMPTNVPERVARNKLVEELLDRIAEHGFLTMGDVRDAISRNNLKLSDCTRMADFLGGDQLLRADRRLRVALDGVYNGAEVYRRWMQQLSSWAFGTPPGRLLTRFVAVPFGGAYLALAGLEHLLHMVFGSHEPAAKHGVLTFLQVLILGLFLAGLIHVDAFRQTVGRVLKRSFHFARDAVVYVVQWCVKSPLVQFVFHSPWFRLGMRFLVKPLLLTLLVWWAMPQKPATIHASWGSSVVIFLALSFVVNSRVGRNAEELLAEWLLQSWQRFGLRFFTNLFWLVMDVFKWLLQATERVLYTVDEWLRFRSGQSSVMLGVKASLGVLWFAVTYVVRFCVNLLIEPQVNPIKHFPVVTVSHKLLLPFIPHLGKLLSLTMEKALAYTVAGTIITGIPGIFGFLVWELKENWRLYGANRPRRLKAVPIGHHGETLVRLLKPGFHSGTLGKQFTRLRRAEEKARVTGNWAAVRKHLRNLQQTELAVRRFLEREFLALLREGPGGPKHGITVEDIALSSNRIRVDVAYPVRPAARLQLQFEVQSGWLLAAVPRRGWTDELSAGQRQVLRTALLGLYKLGSVDLIREQLEMTLPSSLGTRRLDYDGLVLWPRGTTEAEVHYDLRDDETQVAPRATGGAPTGLPVVTRSRFVFTEVPVTWSEWIDAWSAAPTAEFLPGVQAWLP
jgi:hypothetical protein